jgi:hypothetical protein
MKTLVIHPSDRSTAFLKQIYEGRDFTVVNAHKDINIIKGDEGYSKKKFIEQVKAHDRIIMMGHGYPGGLFYSYVDSTVAYLLREKECICIWCNADQFVNKYGLKGFYTGMFISEVGEANYFHINTTQKEVDYSNQLFTRLVTENVDNPAIQSVIKQNYIGDCPVIRYNNERLYYRDDVDNMERDLANRDLNDELLIF